MRIMYVLHRYHTNQIAIMKGWKEHGDELKLLTWYTGKVEDHTAVVPETLGYSGLFESFYRFYMSLPHRNAFAKDINLHYGFPPFGKFEKEVKEFKPDLVILRERSIYTMVCYRVCRKYGIPAFLYNLSPVWAEPSYFKHDFMHRFVRSRCPEYRITPTRQIGIDMTGKVRDPHSYWAPFLVEPMCPPEEKKYFYDDRINIFEIGKYQERKNHFMMVRVFARLRERYPKIHLTIAGECSDPFHEEYYNRLCAYLKENHLEDAVTLYRNLSKQEVNDIYRRSDIYVLASTGEPASISVIESMSFCVPSLSGTDNGTADYIRPGITGEVFRDCDEDDLYKKLSGMLANPDRIPEMGAAGYQSVLRQFQFANYYSVIREMMEDQKKGI